MTPPLGLRLLNPHTAHAGESHSRMPQWLLLAASASIGIAGTLLSDLESAFRLEMGCQWAFGVGLSLFVASGLRKPRSGDDATDARFDSPRHVRVLSRQIYLVMYVLAATKAIQVLFRGAHSSLALQDAMQGLWPYFVGALISLVLARRLAAVPRSK